MNKSLLNTANTSPAASLYGIGVTPLLPIIVARRKPSDVDAMLLL